MYRKVSVTSVVTVVPGAPAPLAVQFQMLDYLEEHLGESDAPAKLDGTA